MRRSAASSRRLLVASAMGALLALNACAGTKPPAQIITEVATTPVAVLSPTAITLGRETLQVTIEAAQAECVPPAEPARPMTEGPYFKSGSPQRASLLEPATVGERLVLSGYVLSIDCKPMAEALLDFWQADGNGVYDNAGYGLRGHQFTDAAGRYELTTVIPGLYAGRTEHIHVKVQAPGGSILTTQLFFPNVEGNQSDRIFDERLVITLEWATDGWAGSFDFIVSEP